MSAAVRAHLRLLHFIKLSLPSYFTMKQLSLRVGYSVWLVDQLQLYENEILVKIIPYALKTMF
jgi:hypothetical protein